MNIRLFVYFGLCAVLVAACATKPRWTPETVALPATPPSTIEVPAPLPHRTESVSVPAPAEAEKPVPLTRDGALLTAFLHNQDIDVARFGPQIAQTGVPVARAAFDPTLAATASTGHIVTPPAPIPFAKQFVTPTVTPAGAPSIPMLVQGVNQTVALTQQLVTFVNQAEHPGVTTNSSQESVTIQEVLPTGTQLFLTGTGSQSDTYPGPGNDYNGAWSAGITQPLLRGAGTSVNLVALRQAKNLFAEGQHAFRATVLSVVQQAELAYWALVLDQQVLKIQQFGVSLAQEQLKRSEDLMAVGRGILSDVLQARAQLATQTASLTDAQAALRSQNLTLIRLLNTSAGENWNVTFDPQDPPDIVEVAVDPNESQKLALQYRPELAQAKLELANRDLDRVTAQNGLLPQLNLVASYGRASRGETLAQSTRDLSSNEFENSQIGFQFQTSFLDRAERARNRHAKLSQSQAELTVADTEQSIATAVRQAVVAVHQQWDRIGATQDAVKSLKEALRIQEGRYVVGKATSLDVLTAQRDLIQAEVNEVSARVNYIQALTSLYGAEGTLLERRGITMDMYAEN